MDTTAPESPYNFFALGGERKVTLRWRHDDPNVEGFAIHRSLQPEELENLLGRAPEIIVSIDPTIPWTGESEFHDEPLDGLRLDEAYVYKAVAVKLVRQGPGPEDILEIFSAPSTPVQIRAIDSLLPQPPSWTAAKWWDPQTDSVADAATNAPVVRLSWSTSLRDAACVLYQRNANESLWHRIAGPLTSNGSSGGQFEYSFFDTTSDPQQAYEYEIEVTNRLGRKNIEFNLISLPSLR